jgi:hypothetical protein
MAFLASTNQGRGPSVNGARWLLREVGGKLGSALDIDYFPCSLSLLPLMLLDFMFVIVKRLNFDLRADS